MDVRLLVVVLVTLVLAAAFLFAWMRRDRGVIVSDRRPDVLHERLDGRSPESGRSLSSRSLAAGDP